MSSKPHCLVVSSLCALLVCGTANAAASSAETRNLTELRNTVVNLLNTLVERGVVTREQAQAMVKDAQTKAEAESAAMAAQEKAEEGAVRVPYVPEIVKDQIRKEVLAELGPSVTKEVVEKARSEDTLRAALPDWVQRMRWTGDVRVRAQGDVFADGNAAGGYLDFNNINDKGGATKAGLGALVNVSEDRERLRARLRFGFDVDMGSGWSAAMRIATGTLRDAVSTNQTLGNYGARYTIGVDQAYLRWVSPQKSFNASAGRIPNPWMSTDLVFDPDLMFEGAAANYRLNLGSGERYAHNIFATVGAFPLQEIELSAHDKWLYAGQLGIDWRTSGGHRFCLGAAYYDYRNIAGQANAPDSVLLDYTAPPFFQRGNTVFDIRNDTDNTTNLYALASDFELADVTASAEWRMFSGYRIGVTADYVKNLGYDAEKILARTGRAVPERSEGYQAELGFGSYALDQQGMWRAAVGYRYLERDAVLDAFTDSDFRLGGTDVKGYTLTLDYMLTPRVTGRLRYLSGNEIDGPPFGVDVIQLDVNAQF